MSAIFNKPTTIVKPYSVGAVIQAIAVYKPEEFTAQVPSGVMYSAYELKEFFYNVRSDLVIQFFDKLGVNLINDQSTSGRPIPNWSLNDAARGTWVTQSRSLTNATSVAHSGHFIANFVKVSDDEYLNQHNDLTDLTTTPTRRKVFFRADGTTFMKYEVYGANN